MLQRALSIIDTFIKDKAIMERADLSVARNFVFTHLVGPALCQSISFYLYFTDPHPGFACWTIIICVCMFWALPWVYKKTGNLHLAALLSVELLTFVSLFGTFNYGGVSSPFLPWLIVALMLGFFYLADRTYVIVSLFAINFVAFCLAYFFFSFPQTLSPDQLAAIGWISIFTATIYISWMAMYYGNIMSMRSELEIEVNRHYKTTRLLLEAKRQAEEASRAKSIFLAKMSHEFRTPLNAVIGYSELMLEELGDQPPEDGSEKISDLKRINNSGKHLLELINDILDLSKIESNTIEIVNAEFDLDQCCIDIMQTIEPMVIKNGNTLVTKGIGTLGKVNGDETKLRQILLNLLSNAAKFTSNGSVRLEARRQSVSGVEWLDFRVIDSGIGIAPESLKKLFNTYQQASTDTASKYGGTGLGLAISQKLCMMMGGSISVTSDVGHGSCFTVRLPSGVSKANPATEAFTLPLAMAV